MRATKQNMAAHYHPISERLPGPVARLVGFPARAKQFLRAVRLELRHVTWPTWQDVRATTVVVIIAVFFFGFYLGLVLDRIVLGPAMQWLLRLGETLVG
ncbi:MAG: preprotein translocase subunit SecE [Terriglobia bacterium]